jgi:hypothetical protein
MKNFQQIKETADEFVNILHDIYGFYADSTTSFTQFLKEFETSQKINSLKLKVSVEELDKATMTYANGKPNDPDVIIFHECTQKELKDRMKKTGKNTNYVSQFSLAMIYEFWENKYREKFSEAIGLKKNDLKSDIFGDIRLIRHDILHARGLATINNSSKTKILKWFQEGELILITEEKFQNVIVEIFKYVNTFFIQHYQQEAYPDHSLSLNGRKRHRNTKHTITNSKQLEN